MTGRPPKLQQTIAHTKDGQPVTVHDRIVTSLRAGNYIEASAALAGITKQSVYEWLKIGAQASADLANDRTTLTKLTKHQRDCLAFSDAVAEAQAAAEVRDVATLSKLAEGGATVTTVTEKKDQTGNVVETTTRTEVAQPSAQVLQWRLERRFPDRWGRRRIEVSGPDGEAIPVEARVAGLVAAARAFHGDGARADDPEPEGPELPADEADD